MPQHLADLDQRCPGSQHLRGRGVPQHVRGDGNDAGPTTGSADHVPSAFDGERPGPVSGAREQRSMNTNSPAAQDVIGHGLTDILG
jgi:hypothetical protein